MTLPEYKTASNIRLQEIVDNAGEEGLFNFPSLSEDDCRIFGAYIQHYNYIELNLRRSLEIFCRARILENQNDYQLLQDAQLISTLTRGIEVQQPLDRDEVLRNLAEIERLRDIRHLLAHWAARRFPDDDAVILFTKNGREIKKLRHSISHDTLSTAILMMADLRRLLSLVAHLGEWLATKTSEWHRQYIP